MSSRSITTIFADTYSDDRGEIIDLKVTPNYSVTHISFTNGSVRGNHYHKATRQIDVVLKGKLLVRTPISETTLVAGDQIVHEPGIPHAYKAREQSEMVSMCFGIRLGNNFEDDTFRLEKPLIV